ncbi:hypothetical protein OJ920_10220, partial [Streptococcus anginosus]|nr:hypothetical protein [Streptococcus anginosus]
YALGLWQLFYYWVPNITGFTQPVQEHYLLRIAHLRSAKKPATRLVIRKPAAFPIAVTGEITCVNPKIAKQIAANNSPTATSINQLRTRALFFAIYALSLLRVRSLIIP